MRFHSGETLLECVVRQDAAQVLVLTRVYYLDSGSGENPFQTSCMRKNHTWIPFTSRYIRRMRLNR